MAVEYEKYTPEALKTEMLSWLDSTVETREGSYANNLLSPVAFQMYKIYQLVPWILATINPDETAGELIDQRAADFGIERTPGTRAAVTLRFTSGFVDRSPAVPAGTIAQTQDGLRFITLEDAVFEGRTADVPAAAENTGRAYNVNANTIVVMAVNISGVIAVTNPAAAMGGADDESDADLLERFRSHLRRPVSSGNVNHYIQWATEVPGVSSASVEPLWDGPGTVKVIIAGPDKTPVDSIIIEACAAHIEEERPIGADVTVVSVAAMAVDVEAAVTLVSGYTTRQVEEELSAALASMLAALPYGQTNLIRYSRCLALLLDCAGVEEYHAFTVNGGTANVIAPAEMTSVVGTVTVTEREG